MIKLIYQKLFNAFGPQHWWPGETPFEIIVGAILTQNTNWGNVEKAVANLKRENLLTPVALKNVPSNKLARLIKPSGYFNIKTKRLKNFIHFLFSEYRGDLQRMSREPLEILRRKLLAVNGIGPETADSILLYAFEKSIFVVDAYTKRMLSRHALVEPDADYATIQKVFMEDLEMDAKLFNEYHALIVKTGKDFCKTSAQCESCPLKETHYSLRDRCRECYRYLPQPEDRQRMIYQKKRKAEFFKKLLSKNPPQNRERFYLCSKCRKADNSVFGK